MSRRTLRAAIATIAAAQLLALILCMDWMVGGLVTGIAQLAFAPGLDIGSRLIAGFMTLGAGVSLTGFLAMIFTGVRG